MVTAIAVVATSPPLTVPPLCRPAVTGATGPTTRNIAAAPRIETGLLRIALEEQHAAIRFPIVRALRANRSRGRAATWRATVPAVAAALATAAAVQASPNAAEDRV